MKLAELKTALISQFFSESSTGLAVERVSEVYSALAALLKSDLSALTESDASQVSSTAEPSKGFKKFTDGRKSLLVVLEDDRVIFAAARVGKNIAYTNLTLKETAHQLGDLAVIKDALRQAKKFNDDVAFSVTNKD